MGIPDKIKSVRVQKGLSQNKLAELIGFSQSYIADIESGRTPPSRNFLSALQIKTGVSLDWLMMEHQVLELIEANKHTENPNLIYVFAFTAEGLDESQEIFLDLLAGKNCLFVDAAGIRTPRRFLIKTLGKEGISHDLWEDLELMLLEQEVILIIKCMSISGIPSSGGMVRSIFKIMDDAWERGAFRHKMPKSSLVLIDYPSYLEKNMTFGFYAVPVYLLNPYGGHVK